MQIDHLSMFRIFFGKRVRRSVKVSGEASDYAVFHRRRHIVPSKSASKWDTAKKGVAASK